MHGIWNIKILNPNFSENIPSRLFHSKTVETADRIRSLRVYVALYLKILCLCCLYIASFYTQQAPEERDF